MFDIEKWLDLHLHQPEAGLSILSGAGCLPSIVVLSLLYDLHMFFSFLAFVWMIASYIIMV